MCDHFPLCRRVSRNQGKDRLFTPKDQGFYRKERNERNSQRPVRVTGERAEHMIQIEINVDEGKLHIRYVCVMILIPRLGVAGQERREKERATSGRE